MPFNLKEPSLTSKEWNLRVWALQKRNSSRISTRRYSPLRVVKSKITWLSHLSQISRFSWQLILTLLLLTTIYSIRQLPCPKQSESLAVGVVRWQSVRKCRAEVEVQTWKGGSIYSRFSHMYHLLKLPLETLRKLKIMSFTQRTLIQVPTEY